MLNIQSKYTSKLYLSVRFSTLLWSIIDSSSENADTVSSSKMAPI